MIHIKDHKSAYIFDPWGHLGPKRRKLMNTSWAGLFREKILCQLPIEKLVPFFSFDFGRPTKELYTLLGVLILQQMHDLSDTETVEQLAFSLQWQYALDILNPCDTDTYMCAKTLWNIRKIVTEHKLEQVLFEKVVEVLAKEFAVDTRTQRLDSVHIRSNMRHLGRIGIFAKSIHKFLINLRRQHKDLFASLSEALVERYLSKKALSAFSLVKPTEAAKTLSQVSTDVYTLCQHFKDEPRVTGMSSYHLLLRVLEEQCTTTKAPESACSVRAQEDVVTVKPPKEIPSDSLQNPSDPDATYDGHKGQGYQVQVMETYTRQKDEKTLNLITHVAVEQAHQSDANALIPALQSTHDRGCAPCEVLADSLYGSDENCSQAKEMGVEVVSPTMGAPYKSCKALSDFEFSEEGKVSRCPQGHAPVKYKIKNGRHRVGFDSITCSNCPLVSECPVKQGKKYYYLRFDEKSLRIALRRAREKSEDFIDRYRFRSGIEATMSEYDARTGVKHLRVRGLKAVRFCAILKAIGINIYRATAVRRAVNVFMGAKDAAHRDYFVVHLYTFNTMCYFKERFCSGIREFLDIFTNSRYKQDFEFKMAA
jgi:hypothetical protein